MHLSLKDLEGSWYINQSNFPMWLKGDKSAPQFYYQIAHKKGELGLVDIVSYKKNNKIQQIKGFDKVLNPKNTQFLWRGRGWLSWVTSQWEILHLSPEKDWGIIFFKKTWFTPAGYDVISKYPQLSHQQLQGIQSQLQHHAISVSLRAIPQTARNSSNTDK